MLPLVGKFQAQLTFGAGGAIDYSPTRNAIAIGGRRVEGTKQTPIWFKCERVELWRGVTGMDIVGVVFYTITAVNMHVFPPPMMSGGSAICEQSLTPHSVTRSARIFSALPA